MLEAQGVGHCTINYPNACAMRAIREYFRTGEVKAAAPVVCAPVAPLFGEVRLPSGLDEEETRLWRATVALSGSGSAEA